MGREAVVQVEAGKDSGEARALLESRELILRGEVRRRWPLEALTMVRAEGDELRFQAGDEGVTLVLGASMAADWARRMTAPPTPLRKKLGVGDADRVFVIGALDDEALVEALAGAVTADPTQATLFVARIEDEADIDAALAAHVARPDVQLWAVYPKGKVPVGDTRVRERLRAAGYRDSKSCAVSDRLTATRYGLPKG